MADKERRFKAEDMTKAEIAVIHILRRVQENADFAWLMIGTESLSLCFDAYAEMKNLSVELVREKIESNAATSREEPEIVQLRRALDAKTPADCGVVSIEQFDALAAVEDLLWQAKCGHDVLTIDNLETAIQT